MGVEGAGIAFNFTSCHIMILYIHVLRSLRKRVRDSEREDREKKRECACEK